MIEEVRFAADSPLEGDGFEPSVPVAREPVYIAEGELRGDRRAAKKIWWGTGGSNPSASSGESGKRQAHHGLVAVLVSLLGTGVRQPEALCWRAAVPPASWARWLEFMARRSALVFQNAEPAQAGAMLGD